MYTEQIKNSKTSDISGYLWYNKCKGKCWNRQKTSYIPQKSKENLLKAQANPDEYSDLDVRIGGYSDYFVKLSPTMQEEVLLRTEHGI